jgi:hypothetical protein
MVNINPKYVSVIITNKIIKYNTYLINIYKYFDLTLTKIKSILNAWLTIQISFVMFCLSHWYFPNLNALHHVLGTIGKPLMSRGASRWSHYV